MSEVMERVDERTQLVGRNRLELLLFYLGDQQCFGINVFKVREVIECPELVKTPDAHQYVCGMANIRGKTISIVDLAAMIGKRPMDSEKKQRVIVAEFNRCVQGFLVSDVARIVNLNWEQIKPPPTGIGARSFLTAVTDVDGILVEVLDVEKVLADILGPTDELPTELLSECEDSKLNTRHVLVVDDSAMARKQICNVLDQLQLGYTVMTNGKEAYGLLLHWLDDDATPIEERCHLIISDVEMPEMDGYTLTKKIKEHPQLEKLQVLLHSSLSGSFNETMVQKVGADDFISKYKPEELAKRLLKLLHLNEQE